MERYPYEATIVRKDQVKPPRQPKAYAFLGELKDRLEPGQAIQLVLPKRAEAASIAAAWRRLCKGLDPHTFSRRRDENSYTVYLWLGSITGND